MIDYGKDSKEKTIQKLREQSVLQALFFNKNMLPDNPQEPDPEHEEPEEPKVIPFDDVSFFHNETGIFFAYFIADTGSYSQLKIVSFFPNSCGKNSQLKVTKLKN